MRIGRCEIAPKVQGNDCNPQHCESEGGRCIDGMIYGTCIQAVMMPGEDGTAEPVRKLWLRVRAKKTAGVSAFCSGCACKRTDPVHRTQVSPNHTPAITSSAADGAVIDDDRLTLQALARLAMDPKVIRKQRHETAPYAFSPRGVLYKDYRGVLTDGPSGAPIVLDERAKSLMYKQHDLERVRSWRPADGKAVFKKAALETGPRMGFRELANMVMDKKISREQRHEMAPYAFSLKGTVYKDYIGILDAVDRSGARIVSEKKAKTLGAYLQRKRLRHSSQSAEDVRSTSEEPMVAELLRSPSEEIKAMEYPWW